jgi:AcrR family transcriptional regulator
MSVSSTVRKSRAYRSPLRQAQAADTRERILQATMHYLERGEIDDLTLRQVADLAGVSAPTIYAHFPTMDDLIRAVFFWLRPRVGMDMPLPPLDQLASVPGTLFPLYAQHGNLIRNLQHKAAWDRQRVADRDARHGAWIAAIGKELPKLDAQQLRRGALAVSAFWTPTVWRWLIEICGFSPQEAQQIAAWGVRALVEALRRDPSGLADQTKSANKKEAACRPDPKQRRKPRKSA